MIKSDEELENALERVSAWLENPPKAGSPEEECFNALLGDIENYRPTLIVEDEQPKSPERAALLKRADELGRRLADHHASLMDVVDGAVRAAYGQRP